MNGEPTDINGPSLLEPEDREAFRQQAHRALDVALDFVERRPEMPVWAEIPEHIKTIEATPPARGRALDDLVDQIRERVMPYTLGNTHPRFWGWVNGSGTPSGVVADMLGAALNANMGGRDHAPMYIEQEVIQWMKTLFGYPTTASGIICTGTSGATLLGLAVARQRAAGAAVREKGNNADGALVAYCSEQAHVSVSKAMELLGLGSDALRAVPVGGDYAMDCSALADMMATDSASGLRPFAVVSAVGSVNTGAVDDLQVINALCRETGTWHHVDGAFGALAILSAKIRPRLAGIEQADSLAFDFHKWMHVGYAAGCLLVRDGELHRQTFATSHAYLRGENQGLAAGHPWPNDYGIELSRGFAALRVWLLMQEMGTEKLGFAIERNCRQAAWLAAAVEQDAALQLLAPTSLNIVCFRYLHPEIVGHMLDHLNKRIVIELQCRGIAAPSYTELDDRTAIRVCITNHRTRRDDLQALLVAVSTLGEELASEHLM